ncbi:MAG: DUF6265 family protein [Maricaulaceae bacterium]|jgi:hypothetical protein
MKKLVALASVAALAVAPVAAYADHHEGEAAEAPDIASLTWLAGTRHIAREDGTISYETWTGPSGGVVSGSVAAAINGGFVEFFRVMPNEDGVYGLHTANSAAGLDNWRFTPLQSIEPGKVVFAMPDGSSSFSIEATPDGGIHNIAMGMRDGELVQTGEWYWLPYPPADEE